MKIIYQGRVWEDGDVPSLEVSDVCGVPTEELTDLLYQILSTFQSRKQLDTAEEVIKQRLNLVRPEEAAAIGKLKLKSTDLFYSSGYNLNLLKLDEKIPEHQLKDVSKPLTSFFVVVELPTHLQKQVNAYKKKQEEEKRKKEERKKQQAIAKAKKLLESTKNV